MAALRAPYGNMNRRHREHILNARRAMENKQATTSGQNPYRNVYILHGPRRT